MFNYFFSFLFLFSVNAAFGMQNNLFISDKDIQIITKDNSFFVVNKRYYARLNDGTRLVAQKALTTGTITVWSAHSNQTFDADCYYLFKNIYNERNSKN